MVGADGWHSVVNAAVRPDRYNEKPPLLAAYYSNWSGLPTDGNFEVHIRPNRGFGAAPTHDGLTIVVGGWGGLPGNEHACASPSLAAGMRPIRTVGAPGPVMTPGCPVWSVMRAAAGMSVEEDCGGLDLTGGTTVDGDVS